MCISLVSGHAQRSARYEPRIIDRGCAGKRGDPGKQRRGLTGFGLCRRPGFPQQCAAYNTWP